MYFLSYGLLKTSSSSLFEVNFTDRERSLENKDNSTKKNNLLPFVTQYHPALPNLKNILMGKWHLIQNDTAEIRFWGAI